MVCNKGVVFLVLISVGYTLSWPWKSEQTQEEHLSRQKRGVNCKNQLDCFRCDEIKRKNQCGGYMLACPQTCNPACSSTEYADQPYKPCASIKQQGNCKKPMPYSDVLWLTVCEKSCCVLDTPPHWGKWSAWGSCSKSCNFGYRGRYRECKGAGFGQTCKGLPFESVKCNAGVPCKGTVGWKDVTTTVEENVGKVTLTIVRTVKTDCEASIKVNTKDGTAVQPGDYGKIENLVINFAKNEKEKTVTFTINKDRLIEPLESFTAIITAHPSKLNVKPAVTTINIKDCTAKIGLLPTKYEVRENLKIVKVTLYRKGCLRDTNAVCISTANNKALAPGDFIAISKQKVVFAPKDTSKEVSITIVNDGVEEQDEDFFVVLGCADPSTIIDKPGKATVVIKDDDVDGNWTEWGPYGKCSKSCGSGLQKRSRTCTNPKPQGGGKRCDGLAISSKACNTHHCPRDGKWTEWSKWSEGSRSCGGATRYRTRTCTNPAPKYGGKDCVGESKQTEGCNSQPCPAKVGLKPKTVSVLENVGKVVVTVFRVGNEIGSNTCKIKTVVGTAKAAKDFVAIAEEKVVFGVGDSKKTVSVNIVDDKVLEPTEKLQVVLSCSEDPGVKEVSPDTTTITIVDDDVQIGLKPNSYRVLESDGKVTLKVFRKGYLKNPNTGIINTCDQTAKAGKDYGALKDVVVTFAAGETSKNVVVNIVDDKVLENTENFCATLSTKDPKVSRVDPKKAVITILDEDVQIGLKPNSYRVLESDGKVTLKVFRKGYLKNPNTGIINTCDQTAKAGKDYGALKDVVVTFAAGETSKNVVVNIVDDKVLENTENFCATLSTKDPKVSRVDPKKAVITILDEDVQIGLKPNSYRVLESAGKVTLKVFRKGYLKNPNTGIINTCDQTAKAGKDYGALKDVVVTFAAGETSKNVVVNIVDDKVLENTENFCATLSTKDPKVSRVDPKKAVITILDNDVQIGLEPTSYSVRETDGKVTIKVFRKGYLKNPNTGIINTCDQTAKAGEDYGALKDIVVTFAADEASKNVVINIVDDKVLEEIENFCATLTTKDPKVSKVDPKKAVITIVDNDVKVGFRPAAYEIVESKPYVKVSVYRVGNLKGVTKVLLNSIADTASEGSDYIPLTKNFVVTFLAGDSLKSFNIKIVNNNVVEPLEDLKVKMTTNDKDVTKILPDIARIKIIDDDAVFSIQPQYCVPETVGSLKVLITRKGATDFEHIATVNSNDISATAPADYGKIADLDVKFAAKQLTKEVTVKIIDDKVEEGPEKFKLVLTTRDPRATVQNSVSVINIEDNDVDGKLSEWSAWSACGKTCGISSQRRVRFCDPAPQGGGAACDGSLSETRSCFIAKYCPVDGGFSNWTVWGDCSRSCGGGFQLKKRTCTNPAPKYVGKPCIGSLVEAQACNKQCCPVDGQWSYWGKWSECKDGKLIRTRKCNDPTPSCGGKECEGGAAAATQSKDCAPPSPCSSPYAVVAPPPPPAH